MHHEPDSANAGATLSDAMVGHLKSELIRIDGVEHSGWSRKVFALVGTTPGVTPDALAAQMSQDADAFKTRMRHLSALGLVEPLASGYRLTARGQALAASWK